MDAPNDTFWPPVRRYVLEHLATVAGGVAAWWWMGSDWDLEWRAWIPAVIGWFVADLVLYGLREVFR